MAPTLSPNHGHEFLFFGEHARAGPSTMGGFWSSLSHTRLDAPRTLANPALRDQREQ
jgi:hypothetical protein